MLDVSSHVDVHIQVPQQVWLEVGSESGTHQSKALREDREQDFQLGITSITSSESRNFPQVFKVYLCIIFTSSSVWAEPSQITLLLPAVVNVRLKATLKILSTEWILRENPNK